MMKRNSSWGGGRGGKGKRANFGRKGNIVRWANFFIHKYFGSLAKTRRL